MTQPPAPSLAARAPQGIPRRALLQTGALVLLLGRQHLAFGASILAVRIWPAPDYSRVTLESDVELKAKQTFIPSPPRLAVDLEGVELTPTLQDLVAKVRPDDPNIAKIRVGQSGPGKIRLVIDLKQPIRPQVFTLAPVANYKYRLVMDLYPSITLDPLQVLVAEHLAERPVASVALGTSPAPALPAASKSTGSDPLDDLIGKQNQLDTLAAATVVNKPPVENSPHATRRSPIATPSDQALLDLVASRDLPARPEGKSVLGNGTERLIIVTLDPGHGGEDPGAVGPGGTREKDVVLQIAQRLRDRINATTWNGNPMRAYMTRDADFLVPLRTRVQKAQKVQADLFISLHADAFSNPQAKGASVFALSQGRASSEAARWMASQENKADQIGGVNTGDGSQDLRRAIFDMSTTAQIRESLSLGGSMIRHIGQVGSLHKGSVEQASFAVLTAPDIPSVLVETAFISNPEEEDKLKTEAYQTALADALMKGIEAYFQKNPPLARNRTV